MIRGYNMFELSHMAHRHDKDAPPTLCWLHEANKEINKLQTIIEMITELLEDE